MPYLIFVRLTGWLALPWIRRGLPVSAALSALAWPGSSRCPNRPSGGRDSAPGSREQAGHDASTAGLTPGSPAVYRRP
jgi:hypothetical protein